MTDTQAARAHELLYSCDSREELCERVAGLEELVRELYGLYAWADGATHYGGEPAVFAADRREVEQRMRELGVGE